MKKIEWAKSRARSLRYQEEVQIVAEEMKRTLRFFVWKANTWRERATARENISPEHAEGLLAYAERQISILHGLHNSCTTKWRDADRMILMAKMEVETPELLFARLERERKKKPKIFTVPLTAPGPSQHPSHGSSPTRAS